MAKRSIVPFGPQHPVLPEPVHLDLVLEDETVVGAIPSIGFIHRGLEKLVEKGISNNMFILRSVSAASAAAATAWGTANPWSMSWGSKCQKGPNICAPSGWR